MTDNVLVSMKRTTFDYNLDSHSYDELVDRYTSEELDRIEDSHETHYDTLETVKETLDGKGVDYEVVSHRFASPDMFMDRDAVISVGGDGTVLGTAKYMEDDTPLLPVRSDGRSRGGLCTVGRFDAVDAVDALVRDRYDVEQWTRVSGHHGATTAVGLNELFLGAADISDVADYTIEHNGETERQNSSGLIVSTGAGSTGWYKNVDGRTQPFDREADELRYTAWSPMDDSGTYPQPLDRLVDRVDVLRELQGSDRYELKTGVIEPGDSVTVTSNMNDDKRGIARYDGDKRDRTYDFSRGKQVEISIADRPLHVVTGSRS